MNDISICYPKKGEEPQETVCQELIRLSLKLQELLPDPSLSPLERVERLGRVIPESIQVSAHHLTARTKLNQIRLRLADLVPDPTLDTDARIDFLVQKTHQLVPEKARRLFEKLEKIGDCRLIDNGAVPFPDWTPADRFWPHLKTQTTTPLPASSVSREEIIHAH